jgi:hypothetical protein
MTSRAHIDAVKALHISGPVIMTAHPAATRSRHPARPGALPVLREIMECWQEASRG